MPHDHITYWAEPLPGQRALLHCDIVVGGKLVLSYPVGSPAPLATVQAHTGLVPLGGGS